MPTTITPRPADHTYARRLPVGAEPCGEAAVAFRVWAPRCSRIDVVLSLPGEQPAAGSRSALVPEAGGYFSGVLAGVPPESRYGFALDGGERVFADPASRYQPEGVDGLSAIVDPTTFPWSDAAWRGVDLHGQVIYELHIGTFTPEGSWQSAARRLPELATLGITVIEVMPIADFPGRFGWGYDGVFFFAPTRLYGTPDDFRRFVDEAHRLGLGVILDVVYNHFGAVGNYVHQFSDHYATKRHANEWSEAINYDDEHSGPVREFFVSNARHWIEEYHLDGFRFDATQAIFDASEEHILAAVSRAARQSAGQRGLLLVAENEPQDVRQISPISDGGYGLDMIWNDDFHHAAMVRLSDLNEAYFSDYVGTPEEFLASVRHGFIYQGQRSLWQNKPRGTLTRGFPAAKFVSFLENHDQVANSGSGERPPQLTGPNRHRAMTALWLLSPQTPMFFQGQEFSASAPFLFFADFSGEEASAVAEGRAKFLAQFPSLATPEAQRRLHDPADPEIPKRCTLDFSERQQHAESYALHADLLKLRRDDAVFSRQRAEAIEGATLSGDSFVLRYFGDAGDDRLVLVNFDRTLQFAPLSQPLLAPPVGRHWEILWSSEHPRYGGRGTPPVEIEDGWRLPGETTVVMAALPGKLHAPVPNANAP